MDLFAIAAVASAACGGVQAAAPDASTALPPRFVFAALQPHHAAETVRSPGPPCPPETHWDGLACTHVRATCGGWDGLSCDPNLAPSAEQERASRSEFARIDDEARTVCPEDDESKQVYSGNVREIVNAVDAALGHAEQLDKRWAQLRDSQQAPRWEVATIARTGSLYDCIWNSLMRATPTYFNPQQVAALARLNAMVAQLTLAGQASQAQIVQAQIAAVPTTGGSFTAKDKYMGVLETRMVHSYVIAALLARRYGLEGFEFTRASERLPIIASMLGDDKMALYLEEITDPTDPEPDPAKRRHLLGRARRFDDLFHVSP